jgi:hypothetical protein
MIPDNNVVEDFSIRHGNVEISPCSLPFFKKFHHPNIAVGIPACLLREGGNRHNEE